MTDDYHFKRRDGTYLSLQLPGLPVALLHRIMIGPSREFPAQKAPPLAGQLNEFVPGTLQLQGQHAFRLHESSSTRPPTKPWDLRVARTMSIDR